MAKLRKRFSHSRRQLASQTLKRSPLARKPPHRLALKHPPAKVSALAAAAAVEAADVAVVVVNKPSPRPSLQRLPKALSPAWTKIPAWTLTPTKSRVTTPQTSKTLPSLRLRGLKLRGLKP
jgi:hypothetical protein